MLTDWVLVQTNSGDLFIVHRPNFSAFYTSQLLPRDRPGQYQILGRGYFIGVHNYTFYYRFSSIWKEARGSRAIASRCRTRAKEGRGDFGTTSWFPDMSALLAARNYGFIQRRWFFALSELRTDTSRSCLSTEACLSRMKFCNSRGLRRISRGCLAFIRQQKMEDTIP
jgi:hypothetical protein